MARIRLGAVGYLNARPLVYGLGHSARFDLRFDIPSKCADLLHDGVIDLGLIPSIEYNHPRIGAPYAIVTGLPATTSRRLRIGTTSEPGICGIISSTPSVNRNVPGWSCSIATRWKPARSASPSRCGFSDD